MSAGTIDSSRQLISRRSGRTNSGVSPGSPRNGGAASAPVRHGDSDDNDNEHHQNNTSSSTNARAAAAAPASPSSSRRSATRDQHQQPQQQGRPVVYRGSVLAGQLSPALLAPGRSGGSSGSGSGSGSRLSSSSSASSPLIQPVLPASPLSTSRQILPIPSSPASPSRRRRSVVAPSSSSEVPPMESGSPVNQRMLSRGTSSPSSSSSGGRKLVDDAVAAARCRDAQRANDAMVYLDGPQVYTCCQCRTHLTSHDDIISKSFHGRHGRAYLFDQCVNVTIGPAEDRLLITGLHSVCDIYCKRCKHMVGWTYQKAYEASQKYKEGKYIIEKINLHLEESHYYDVAAPAGEKTDRWRKRSMSWGSESSLGGGGGAGGGGRSSSAAATPIVYEYRPATTTTTARMPSL